MKTPASGNTTIGTSCQPVFLSSLALCFPVQDIKMVAAASIDRVVHVWSTQTHKILHRLDGHMESVYCVTFSADGNRLVSGGLDKTIKAREMTHFRVAFLFRVLRCLPESCVHVCVQECRFCLSCVC